MSLRNLKMQNEPYPVGTAVIVPGAFYRNVGLILASKASINEQTSEIVYKILFGENTIRYFKNFDFILLEVNE